jgi:serine/threonine-protein kinase
MVVPDSLTPRQSEPPTFMPYDGGALSFGRYEIIGELAKGGMGTVYLCRRSGEAGFQRLYALKLVHDHLAQDEEVIDMLLDEARIASRIHHAKVVPILDLGSINGRYYLAMDYIEGCSLSQLCRRHPRRRPPEMIVPLVMDALEGLHAAHTLVDDDDNPLDLVHRDVSPQNLLVGVDGIGRVIDFGIVKAAARRSTTAEGRMKGKISYMSPEQLLEDTPVDARSDIFAAGVMLWSALTGMKLFQADSEGATVTNIITKTVPPPSAVGLRPPKCFDAICLRALERNPKRRFQTAEEMSEALRVAVERNGLRAPRADIAGWVKKTFHKEFAARREAIREHINAPPGRKSFASIADVAALPGLTAPTMSRSMVPDVDPALRPRPRRVLVLVAAAGVALGASAIYWLAGRGAEPSHSSEPPVDAPIAEVDSVTPTPPREATAAPSSTPPTVPVASVPPPAQATSNPPPSSLKPLPKPKPAGRDVGY